ncbi:MAG: GLPGLI family protein [Cyclobacteriaceae bacterium]
MNKIKILFLTILVLFYYTGKGQHNGVIEYKYRSYGKYETNMKLLIKDGKSKFIFHKDPKIMNNEDIKLYHYYEHFESFYDFSTQKITEQRITEDNTVLLSEWISTLNWEITDETQEILGYTVRKAIAPSYEFESKSELAHGYAIAWFTTEIPIPSGPERYVGLPGLILKLEFDKGIFVDYTCTLIDLNQNPDFSIPADGIKVTREEIFQPSRIDKKWLKTQKELQ